MKAWSLKTHLQILSLSGLLLLAVSFWAGQHFLARSQFEELRDSTIANQKVLWDTLLNMHFDAMLEQSRTLTRNRGMLKALKSSDKEALREEAMPTFNRIQAGGKAEGMLVADRQGRIQLHAGKVGQSSPLMREFMQRVTGARKNLKGITLLGNGQPVAIVGFPLYARGKPIGAGAFYLPLENIASDLAREGGFVTTLLSTEGQTLSSSNSRDTLTTQQVPRNLQQPSFLNIRSGDAVWATTLLPLDGGNDRSRLGTLVIQKDVTRAASAAARIELIEGTATIGVLVLMALLVSWQMTRAFRPLKKAVAAINAIAEGDLSQEIECSSKNEIAEMMEGMGRMRTQLRQIVEALLENTGALQGVASEASAIVQQSSDGAVRQQNETQSVATAMTEMTSTVMEVANSAASAASAADGANQRAAEGDAAMQSVRASIEQLAVKVQSGAEAIRQVEQESDAIGQILDVIRGIAEQTNLLALNAAIEAARAGEQGRGFAVVADEVRTLASRTQESTSEIQAMIERLQGGTQEAVNVMDESREQAGNTVQQAQAASEVLQAITEAVGQISTMNTQIAVAAGQQSTVAEEINQAVVNISGIAEETAAGAQRANEANQQVSRLANELQALTTRFRL